MKRLQTFLAFLALLVALPIARGSAQSNAIDPVFITDDINQLNMSYDEETKVYTFTTTGSDPFVFTQTFNEALPADSSVLSFEYQCDTEIPDMQIFLPYPIAEANSLRGIIVPASKEGEWAKFQLRLDSYRLQNGWGKVGDCIRIDFGTTPEITIKVRNLHIGAYVVENDLQSFIDGMQYSADEYVYGTSPGCVGDEEAFTVFYDTYNDALQLLSDPSATQEAKDNMLTKLKETLEKATAAIIPLTDGKYYIETAYSVFDGKDTMAWYAPRVQNQPGWKKKQISKLFMWELKKQEDGNYSIQNVGTGQFINHNASVDVADQPLTLSDSLVTEQVISSLGPNGQFLIHSLGANWAYNIQGHAAGESTDGPIANWTDFAVNGEEAWRIVPVSAEELAAVESDKDRDDLAIALAKYGNITSGAVVSNEGLGYVKNQETLDNVSKAISNAQELLNAESATAEEYKAANAALLGAVEAFNKEVSPEVPEGYYRIRGWFDIYHNNDNDIFVGMYDANDPGWKHYFTSTEFLWKVSPKGDGTYDIQNVKSGKYLNKADESTNGAFYRGSDQPETPQKLELLQPSGQWAIHNTVNDKNESGGFFSFDPSAWGAQNQSDRIRVWSPAAAGGGTSWAIIPVSDEEAKTLIANEDQNILAHNLKKKFEEGRRLFNNSTIYTYGDPIVTDKANVYVNNWSPNEGQDVGALIDGNTDTYWNSTWEGNTEQVNEPHYMRYYSEAGFPDSVLVRFAERNNGTWHRIISKMRVDVSNDAETWTSLPNKFFVDDFGGKAKLSNHVEGYMDFVVNGIKDYKYIRFVSLENIHQDGGYYTVDHNHMMIEYSEFNLYPITGVSAESSTMQDVNKPAALALWNAVQAAKPYNDAGTGDQTVYDNLVKAIDAYNTEIAALNEITNLMPRLNDIAINAEVGTGIGFVETQADIDAFWAEVEAADESVNGTPATATATEALNRIKTAYNTLMTHVEKPEPNKWYNIISNTTRAYGLDQPIYLWQTSVGDNLHVGGYQTDNFAYKSDPYAIWRLVPVEGEDNSYYVQNMGTGQYFGEFRGDGAGAAPLLSHTPGIYKLWFYGGNGGFRMRQANVTDSFDNLKADGTNGIVLNYPANGDHQQSWRFEEITEGEMMQFNFFANNSIQIITLPWATKGEDGLNAINGDNVIPYAIKNIETSDSGTSLSLTRKDDIEAGEPMILVVGDYKGTDHSNTSAVQFNVPKDVVDSPIAANGLIGTLEGVTVNTEGMGYFDSNFQLKATTGSIFFAGRSGYIDPSQVVNNEEANEDIVIFTTDKLTSIKTAKVVRGSDIVNVYTIDGTLVKRNVKAANAKNGLAKGLYIIGKQKVLVK